MKTWEEVRAEEDAVVEALKGCKYYQVLAAMSMEENPRIAEAEAANDESALMKALERKVAINKGKNMLGLEYLNKIGHPGYV